MTWVAVGYLHVLRGLGTGEFTLSAELTVDGHVVVVDGPPSVASCSGSAGLVDSTRPAFPFGAPARAGAWRGWPLWSPQASRADNNAAADP